MRRKNHWSLRAATVIASLGLVVGTSCQPESLTGPVREGVTFTVTTVDAPTTKSPGAAPAAVPVTTSAAMPGLTGDPTPGNEYGMTVEESPLRLDRTAEAPATKATFYDTDNLPASLGLLPYTRAEGSTAWALYPSGGGVTPLSRDGRETGVTSGKWIPAPEARLLWPREGYIRYYAYAPYVGGSSDPVSVATAYPPTLSYTVPTTVSAQTDLLVTDAESTKEYAGDPGWRRIDVPLKLDHALTGIRFRLVEGLTIDKVTISGVRNKGTLNLSSSPLSWTGASDSDSYTLSNLSLGSGLVADTDPAWSGYNVTDDANTFLLLPQTLPASAKITVTVQNATDPSLSREITADIAGQEWRPGTMVTYTITRSDIKISSTINPYNPGSGFGDGDFTYTVLPELRTIRTGESFTLSASSTSTPAPDFTYTTNDDHLITLSETSGASTMVTGKSPGTATVTVKATRGSIVKEKTCTVTVI